MSHPKKKPETVKFDSETRKWFDGLPLVDRMTTETTVARCDDCGLYYKPSLGHKCRKRGKSNV
jgi:hypothetical protein